MLREAWSFVYIDEHGKVSVEVTPPPGVTGFNLPRESVERAVELFRDQIRDGTARGESRWARFCEMSVHLSPFTFHT